MALKKVDPPTLDFYRNNRIVTAERMAEIDRKLAEILPKLKDDQITPGRPERAPEPQKRSKGELDETSRDKY